MSLNYNEDFSSCTSGILLFPLKLPFLGNSACLFFEGLALSFQGIY
ncbi:hypothetical protein FHR87_003598 [Azomonas macrocytogenes]|uniref:Uncharacterized protein n=1 Tax=Azomonas macrocytogenes TaxID=69962 RepID=A0A839TC36_AZOMA|nr:hypothetical protein [Azomonas macrocytogenes]